MLLSLRNALEDGVEPERPAVQVFISSTETSRSIRSLTSDDVSRLVCIPGIIIASSRCKARGSRGAARQLRADARCSRAQSKAVSLTVQCKSCKNTKSIPCAAGFGGAFIPRTCDLQPGVGAPGAAPACGMDPFVVLSDRSVYIDQQTLKLQENPEDVPAGEMPRNLLLVVERHAVQRVVPGTRVTVMGIYSIHQSGPAQGRGQNKAAVAIRQPYLRVMGIEAEGEGSRRSAAQFTDAEVRVFKEFAARPCTEVLTRIRDMVGPSIFGHADIKAAIACLLFGGSRKRLADGVRLRGDVNVLLIGDPSTAKSQFLKFVEKTAPIAVYTSGKGSSAAGLTASVIRDPTSGEFYLEGGAMVLADGGVVCIDEFDKMRAEDRVAIHEAMEQQTISIAKAGITTVLNSRTAVLAAANPPSGRYDDLKSAQENIDLQTTILSRFDLIFIVRDERNFARDVAMASHVVNVHRTAGDAPSARPERGAPAANDERARAEAFLKRYVQYARAACRPRLSEAGTRMLENEYVRIRSEMRDRTRAAGGAPAVPITVRQLEAIVRLSESLAKMCLHSVATEVHVAEALRLFTVSTVDAAKSGLADTVAMSPEQRAQLAVVEERVRQRLPIGGVASKRGLMDELAKFGLAEWAVERALLAMCQRGEMEFRSEGKRIMRKRA